jgi:hypothetical protein
MTKVRTNSIYYWNPSFWDKVDSKFSLPVGTKVRVIQPHGCPKNNTMGHCYIEIAESKQFLGLVSVYSLQKAVP